MDVSYAIACFSNPETNTSGDRDRTVEKERYVILGLVPWRYDVSLDPAYMYGPIGGYTRQNNKRWFECLDLMSTCSRYSLSNSRNGFMPQHPNIHFHWSQTMTNLNWLSSKLIPPVAGWLSLWIVNWALSNLSSATYITFHLLAIICLIQNNLLCPCNQRMMSWG